MTFKPVLIGSCQRGGLLVAALLVFLTCGCSGTYDASVSGTVTYDGNPLDRGTVTFHPNSGAAAYGKIAEDGSYTLQTGDEKGIATGEYRVTVASIEQIPAASPGDPPGAKSLIPNQFKIPSQSGLSYTVEAGSNRFDIDLPKVD